MLENIVNNINSYKGTYADKVEAFIRFYKSTINDNISQGKEGWNSHQIVHYDYTPYCMRKRVEGTVAGISEAKKQLEGILSSSETEAFFAFANALIMKGGFNEGVDWCNVVALCSAIWILDELTLSGKIDEVYQYLPALDEEADEEMIKFPVKHPMYDDSLINALVYLIRHRNTSKCGNNPRFGTLLYEEGKAGKDEKANEFWNAFHAILALVEPGSIETAVQKYKAKIWEFYRIAFSVMADVEKREKKIAKEIDELTKPSKDVLSMTQAPNALLRQNTKVIPFPEMFGSDGPDKNQFKIRQLENELDRLNRVTLTQISLPNDREKLVKRHKDVISEKNAKDVIAFHVEDPFESAFALLYLMDQKSMVPWFYYGSISVGYTLLDQLPFDTLVEEPAKPVRIVEWNDALFRHRYKGYRYPDMTDAHNEPIQREFAKNLSQLVFSNTSSLIPRVVPKQLNMTGFLDGFGELTEREKEAYSLLSYALISGQLRADSASEYQAEQTVRKFREENQKEAEREDSAGEEQKDDAEISLDNKRLRERNKELVELLSSTLSGRKEVSKQLQLLQRRFELQERELADLREAVYILENSGEQKETEEPDIKYPYATKGKIVSFGGHQTWINEMKKKLPEVTFVGLDVLPNIELIRNADAIWLQINCLSHSDFFRIINIVRQAGIPLRYFSFAGSDKCASQIVRSEQTAVYTLKS